MNIKTTEWFTSHKTVTKWLDGGGDVSIGGVSLRSLKPRRLDYRTEKQIQYEAVALTDSHWCRACVAFTSDSPVIELTFWAGNGTTAWDSVRAWSKAWAIDVAGKWEATVGGEGREMLQGQPDQPVHIRYDLDYGRIIDTQGLTHDAYDRKTWERAYGPTKWCVDNPDSTGAWAWMGMTIVKGWSLDQARTRLYPGGCYPGVFVERTTGAFVNESMYPDLVLQNGTHFHRDTLEGLWFKYTDRDPWKDRSLNLRTPNAEHLSFWCQFLEAAAQFPHDPFFRWMTESICARFLFQIPGRDKGTYQWDPGQARAQGRILLVVDDALDALTAQGDEQTDDGYVEAMAQRGLYRLKNQLDQMEGLINAGRHFLPNFEGRDYPPRPDKISANEAGILEWAYTKTVARGNRLGIDMPKLNLALHALREFCFNCFWVDGNKGTWHYPYYITENWDHPPQKRDIMFGWHAAANHQPRDRGEELKLSAIREMGDRLESRFKE